MSVQWLDQCNIPQVTKYCYSDTYGSLTHNTKITYLLVLMHTNDFLYVPPSFFSFRNITVLWFNTTQVVINLICVIFSRRMMSLSICSMVQLYIAREWKYSTNVNCHCQSKTEESKGCNYYLSDLKSDCNNGGKLL